MRYKIGLIIGNKVNYINRMESKTMNRTLVKWIALITVILFLVTSVGLIGYTAIFGG